MSAGGRRIPSGVDSEHDAVPGKDVALTIDRDIQWVAQKAIAKAVKTTGSQSGTVIVMDPHTGDLLAMATAPTFDSNDPGSAPRRHRGNRARGRALRAGQHRQGDHGVGAARPGPDHAATRITVPNRLCRAGKCFKDFENHGTEQLTYAGTIAKSSNIGTIKAAERLGNLKRLQPYLHKFGIGQPTGLGLPGEADGYLLPTNKWSATSGYTMAFGQGYSVNTVQMASVFATIANDGVRVAPRLVAGTTGADGEIVPAPASSQRRVVSAADSADGAVDARGGGRSRAAPRRSPAVPGYRVGGKTGTAQRFDAACRCYRGLHDVVHRDGAGRQARPGRRGHAAEASLGHRRRCQRGAGVQGRHVLRARGAAHPADRHQARQAQAHLARPVTS